MILITMLVKSLNFGKNGNRETKISKSTWKERERTVNLFIRPKVKLRETDKFIRRDNQKYELLITPKRMIIANQNIIREQCIRNDKGVLAVSDEDKKNLEKLLREAFEFSLYGAKIVCLRQMLSVVHIAL